MPTVVFFLVPGLQLLELAGPAQVLATAGELGHPYRLVYLAESPEVPSAVGVRIRAETEWPAPAPGDGFFVPGWKALPQPAIGSVPLTKLAEYHVAGATVAGIGAGVDVLGRAGLLDGRRFTTHHELQTVLGQTYPRAVLVPEVLYVSDDRVLTSAGEASGIDLALALVAAEHGPAFAARVARAMVVYARRNGEELPLSVALRYRGHLNDVVHRVQDLIDDRFDGPLPLASLAAAGGVSERTLTRLFDRATGLTPLRYQQLLRVERAEALIGRGSTVEAAARAVGFTDARMLRRLRQRAPLATD